MGGAISGGVAAIKVSATGGLSSSTASAVSRRSTTPACRSCRLTGYAATVEARLKGCCRGCAYSATRAEDSLKHATTSNMRAIPAWLALFQTTATADRR